MARREDESDGAVSAKAAARLWLRTESSAGRRASLRAVVAPSLLGTLGAIGQALCAASVLAAALAGRRALPLPYLIGFAVLAIVRAVLGAVAERGAVVVGGQARRRIRTDVLARLLAAGPALLRERHSADLATLVVDRIEGLDGMFGRYLPAVMLAVIGPALVAIAAGISDPWAAVVLIGAGLLVPIAMAAAGIGAAMASRNQFVAMARLQARFLDRVRGIGTIVLAGRAEAEAAALGKAAAELRRRTLRVLRVAFLSSAALDLAAALAIVLLALRYGAEWRAGLLTHPGHALFVLLLVPEFFAPIRAFAAAYQDRFAASAAADAIAAVPPMPAPPPADRVIRTIEARGASVAFEHVSFTWDPARGPAINDLSFRVPAGETLVLFGPSGAGKSTVIELLLGFIRADSGRVTINGMDIADLVPEALSRLTSWIGQRPLLFAGSIRDNIRFARPEATDAEVEAAATAARVTAFTEALPQGLDTPIGEGGYGLSGGQAQRVAIARAFLKGAPVLLLDEPTAHLDPASEAEVLDSLRRLAIGRTVVLASHAAAAHAFSGRRLELRQGRLAESRAA